MPLPSGPLAQRVGFALCRVVVPVWVLVGAIFKLVERTPKNLPKNLFDLFIRRLEVHPHGLLATLIAIEIALIAVMVFLGRWARAAAIFMLGVFVLVLIGELAMGNFESCGCFGKLPVPPWAMLVVDGALLISVILFRPVPAAAPATTSAIPAPRRGAMALVSAAGLVVLGAAVSYGYVLPAGRSEPAPPGPVANGGRQRVPLPAFWYIKDIKSWLGQPWRDLEIFNFGWPDPHGMDKPLHYVIFYRRSCDHCQEMFEFDLAPDPDLCQMVTAVEVPEKPDLLRIDRPWPMPDHLCEHLELPLGCDYVMTTPVIVRVENGVVTCAFEGGHRECLKKE